MGGVGKGLDLAVEEWAGWSRLLERGLFPLGVGEWEIVTATEQWSVLVPG